MHCHSYIFFDSDSALSQLTVPEIESCKTTFIEVIQNESGVRVFSFATLGFKAHTRFMLWIQAEEADHIQAFVNKLMHTSLGKHLKITYALFGLIRPSLYSKKPLATEGSLADKKRKKYLIVYPFTKTKEWYLLSFDERKALMIDHMKIGGKFGTIEQQLLYGFGVDDHEFILSYETDSLLDFQSLVMELRSTKGRFYTANDLPVFTCVYGSLQETLKVL
jgi:chlorite dismutase